MNKSSDESAGAAKRRNLFELFARNLNVVKQHPNVRMDPEFSEGYLCPICFKLFERRSLSLQYADHLTLEDVPPQALGGKVAALTCKVCNNRDGTELDSHLVKKFHSDAFFLGASGLELEAVFRPDSLITLPATARFLPGNVIDIRYHVKRSNPNVIERLHDLEATGGLTDVKLSFLLGYTPNRANVALIRIAYLLAFARFGYGFLLNPNLWRVRQQILKPSDKLIPDWGILESKFPDSAVGVSIICEPRSLKAFLVVFDLKLGEITSRYGVILPGPSTPGIDVYRQIAELKQTRGVAALDHILRVIPEGDYLRDPNLAFASHSYWSEICR